jgi:glycosyltransferase involved in cell wall biosynthesis
LKILFISNHFSLPNQAGAPRPWKVAHYLRSLGHEVTIITNRRHYFDENIEVGGTKHTTPQIVQGIKIVGVETTAGRRKCLIKRLLNYFSFSYMSYLVGRKIEKPDVIIVGTPPLIVPLTGLLLAKKHKAFTVLEIRDLFPETAVALGKVKNKMVQFLWEWWENFLRKRYDHIVAVVPRIRKSLLEKGFPQKKVTTITNGFDPDNLQEERHLTTELVNYFNDNKNKFIVAYGGGMGYAINLLTVIQAAERLKEKKSILFVFFGEGERKAFYLDYVRERGLVNCRFFPAQPRNIINLVFKTVNGLVHSFIDNDFFKCALPNKIFEYHGAGKPIIFAGVGDTADLIRKAGSGIVVNPENAQEMADAVLFLSSHPEKAQAMGEAGRAYISEHYRRDVVFQKWDKILEMVERAPSISSETNLLRVA